MFQDAPEAVCGGGVQDTRYKLPSASPSKSCIWYQVSGISHPGYYALIVKVATGFVF